MSRLAPLSPRTFTAAVLIDGAVSPMGLFVLPVLIACVAAVSLGPGDLPWIILSVALLLAGIIGAGQALYLFANRLIASRRFADISMGRKDREGRRSVLHDTFPVHPTMRRVRPVNVGRAVLREFRQLD